MNQARQAIGGATARAGWFATLEGMGAKPEIICQVHRRELAASGMQKYLASSYAYAKTLKPKTAKTKR
jgi:hypothetical protein